MGRRLLVVALALLTCAFTRLMAQESKDAKPAAAKESQNAPEKDEGAVADDAEKEAEVKKPLYDPSMPAERICFSSGARQEKSQAIWRTIFGTQPSVFVFLGNNLYADTDNVALMKMRYSQFGTRFDLKIAQSICPVLAIWNDHDYGRRNAGAEFPKKEESKKIFLDFFTEPEDSPRRQRPGIYDAKLFGPPGKELQIILLDNRTFRSPLKSRQSFGVQSDGKPGSFEANTDPSSTILGNEQWKWLGEQLKVPARIRVIASSFQVISEDHYDEKWMTFPHERKRLFKLIKDSNAAGVIFISGGRNQGEISMIDGEVGYPLYDITAGPLNVPSKWQNEINRHRIGNVFYDPNFGSISIDWTKEDPSLDFYIVDVKGVVRISISTSLSQLQPPST